MFNYKYSVPVIGFIGFVLNLFLFIRFSTSSKKPFSSFHKLCLFKTIPNLIISAVFAFWTSAISILGATYAHIPRIENIIISQAVSGFPYFLAPLIQVCMSVNRFFVIFFPFSNSQPGRLPFTNLAITFCLLLSHIPLLLSALTDCYLVYDPELWIFLPERLEECGHAMDRLTFLTVGILSFLSNGFNLIIFAKLLKDKMVGINEEQKLKRRKKWQKMYIQSVLQDFIQLIDIANYNFTSKLMDTELWSFIFCSLSFAMVYALDGAVMVYFNMDWSFCCIDPKKSSVFVSGAQSSTVKPGGKSNRLIII